MNAGSNAIFNGYQLEIGEGESSLSWQLSSGLTWRKKIWPRLECPRSMHRWNTVEEILGYLISFNSHKNWITTKLPVKPPSGTILFFDKTKTKGYRSDGYDWKTRKTNASVREDRMKLKVCGMQLLYGCYTHCASIPTLHRRSYWLIQDPDIIMVHYLEVDNDAACMESLTPNVDLALQDETEMQRCFAPSSWAYLTISDRNLCSILSRSNTALEVQTLAAQLQLMLDQNLEKATNLDQAVSMNNSGLPFDWVKEAQPKKQRSRVAPKETNSVTHGGAPARLINIGGTSPQGGLVMGSEKADENQILKALSSSPHIILCCPRNGSVSYVLLNSSLAGGLGKVSGEREGGRGGEGRVGEGGRTEGTKSAVRLEGPKSAGAALEGSSSLNAGKGTCGPKGKARVETAAQTCDYDLSQFSNFASRLVDVDPLQGFGRLEGAPLEHFDTLLGGDSRGILPQVLRPSAVTNVNTPRVSEEEEVMEVNPSVQRQLPLPLAPTNQGGVLQSTQQEAASGVDTHNDECFVGCVTTDREMVDLSLRLDPEGLKELFKIPLSPEIAVGGGNDGEGATGSNTVGNTLSPLSELMQSLVPTSEPEREGEFGGGYSFLSSSPAEGLGLGASGSNSLTTTCASFAVDEHEEGGYMDTPSDQREECLSGYAQYLSASSIASSSLPRDVFSGQGSPSLPCDVFSGQGSPLVQESYQWEDLLHPPSSYSAATPSSVQSHSHTVIPHSPQAQTVNHTTSSHSHIPNLHSTSPHSHVHSPHSIPTPHSLPQSTSHMTEQLCTDDHLESLLALTPDNVSLLTSQLLGPTTGATRSSHESNSLLERASSEGLPQEEIQHNQMFTQRSLFPPLQHPLPSPAPSRSSPSSSLPLSVPSDVARTAIILDTGSLPSPSLSRGLSDIPEGVPMNMLLDPLNQHLQGPNNLMEPSIFSLSSYQKSPTPSSPSISSVSGHSTVSSLFDPGGESPSVLELCELLSESPNVQQHDFSNMTFTDTEQKQLYKAIQIIQNTFRKFRTQWQHLPRVEDRQKHAALLIENYYSRYRQLKQQQDKAARRIQHSYRMYRKRSREMNRAALFIQQMYRFHRRRQQPGEAVTSPLHHYMTNSSTQQK